jgi:hypothetical protein
MFGKKKEAVMEILNQLEQVKGFFKSKIKLPSSINISIFKQ